MANLCFSPKLETEYVRTRLLDSRTLVRIACVLTALLATVRGVEEAIEQSWTSVFWLDFGLVVGGSIALAWIAWNTAFERRYMPWARIIVPLRNAVVAVHFADAAVHGQMEMLMVLRCC